MVRIARKRVSTGVTRALEVAAMSPEIMQAVLLDRIRVHGPMLDVCPVPGCSMLTMGGTCVEHDAPVKTSFPRGRPYLGKPETLAKSLRIMGESRPGSPG
jgi:hypothetical protein